MNAVEIFWLRDAIAVERGAQAFEACCYDPETDTDIPCEESPIRP